MTGMRKKPVSKSAPSYEEALKEANRVGASYATGTALLAQHLSVLALTHAINPSLAFRGALWLGLSADDVRKLDAVSLGHLMFVV